MHFEIIIFHKGTVCLEVKDIKIGNNKQEFVQRYRDTFKRVADLSKLDILSDGCVLSSRGILGNINDLDCIINDYKISRVNILN